MRDGVIVLDDKDQIIEINPAARVFLQAAHQDRPVRMGDHAFDVFSIWPDLLERFKDVSETLATDLPLPVGNRTRHIDLRVSPLRDSSSKVIGRVLVATDVSARKQAADLEKAKEAAEAANQAKSAFFASMSHELRTPLNHIIGYSEMLIEEVDFNQHTEFYESDLRKVHQAGKTLLQIITQILDLAKLEAGRVRAEPEKFALNALIEDIAVHMQPLLDDSGNALKLDLPTEPIEMVSDPYKLRQLLVHVMDNAARFTQNGRITVRVIPTADLLNIEVEDTGDGIPDEQLEVLFRSFANTDHTNRKDNQGLGLGLAAAHQLACLLGGEISVRSAIGQGSTFTVQVPRELK